MSALEAQADASSLTDLMAGIAAIFLVIAVVFILVAEKRRQAVADQAHEYKELRQLTSDVERELTTLRAALLGDDILDGVVSVPEEQGRGDPFLLVVVFDREKLRFPTAGCTLNDAQTDLVSKVAPRVLKHVCSFRTRVESRTSEAGTFDVSMTLEGHTDNARYSFSRQGGCGIEAGQMACANQDERCLEDRSLENNVRLSSARAQSVFFAIQRAVSDQPGLATCLEENFVVAGRGPVEPTMLGRWRETQSDAAREENRRVVLKIRAQPALRSPSREPTTPRAVGFP